MSVVPRIVLAGGRASPELQAQIDTPVRALALFQGRRLLDIVVDALAGADPDAPVVAVGSVPDSGTYSRVPDQGDFVANVFGGIAGSPDADWVLITSADMPFLTAETVEEFVRDGLALAADTKADLIYPIVPVADCYSAYPGIRRTAIRLREGELTGGNMMLARPAFLLERRDLLARAYAARKQPFRLAGMLGIGTVLRLAAAQFGAPGILTLSLLERKVGGLVSGRVAALVCRRPEIATDLDRASDFAAAAAYAPTGGAPAP